MLNLSLKFVLFDLIKIQILFVATNIIFVCVLFITLLYL